MASKSKDVRIEQLRLFEKKLNMRLEQLTQKGISKEKAQKDSIVKSLRSKIRETNIRIATIEKSVQQTQELANAKEQKLAELTRIDEKSEPAPTKEAVAEEKQEEPKLKKKAAADKEPKKEAAMKEEKAPKEAKKQSADKGEAAPKKAKKQSDASDGTAPKKRTVKKKEE
jgi:hypothetical protein